jgi:omega-6 fatty acid desaturase (delta-12 desaturase)
MSDTVLSTDRASSERIWLKRLVPYRTPSRLRGLFELAVTILPLIALWALSYVALAFGQWWGLVLTIPAAAFLVRLFMIQHDCGHGSFFGLRKLDDWLGRAIGVLTLTPYDCWRHTHAIHHASSGNLDARGVGDIETLTVAEYRARSPWGRFAYRLYRHPAVMFLFGPIWSFVILQRVPVGMMRGGFTPWATTMATNLAIAAFVVGMILLVGWLPFVLIHVPIVLLASGAGVWLFYVQHQFEDTHWTGREGWEFEHAALHGSSYYDLPAPLRWLTANIGVHHVHHISSRVPYYRLPEVLRDYPELKQVGRIGILESLRGVNLVLWDEAKRKLVSFREARAAA